MRKTILSSFVLSIFLAAALEAGVNHWTPIGPFGGQTLALAADPQQAGVVYAGTWGGVFKSTDGGATWRRTSRGLRASIVYTLAVAPSNRNVIYAGTAAGLFVSRDGAETWQGSLLTTRNALAVAVDPRDARRVWVGTDVDVAWSRDGGATWSFADNTDKGYIRRVPEIAVDPVHPDTVYAMSTPLRDEGDDSTLEAIKTTDGGATWTEGEGLESEAYSIDSLRLAIDPTAPNVLYAALGLSDEDGITYRSTDGGATWHPTPGTYPVAVDRKGVVHAGRMRSVDRGETWQEAAAPPRPVEYAASAAADGTLWAATEGSGIYRSSDRAATWQASSEGLHALSVSAIAVDPELPRTIYAGTDAMGLRKTFSSGLRWRAADAGLPISARGFHTRHLLALDPRQPQTVYLAWSQGFARSDDGGAHWTVLAEGYFDPHRLLVDPATGVVYLSGSYLLDGNCRLARSNDRGATFRCLPPFTSVDFGNLPPVRLTLDPHKPSTLWVAETRNRLWKSTDRGEHWTEIRPRGLKGAGQPSSLAVDPSRPGRLYLSIDRAFNEDQGGVWRSDDGGRSWRPGGAGLPEWTWTNDLLVDPQRPSILYISVIDRNATFKSGDRSGVYWSRDGGRTFAPLRDGLPGGVLHLVQDPTDPRKLYAGTSYNGVYTFTRK